MPNMASTITSKFSTNDIALTGYTQSRPLKMESWEWKSGGLQKPHLNCLLRSEAGNVRFRQTPDWSRWLQEMRTVDGL